MAIDLIDDVDAPLGFDPTVLVGEAGIGAKGSDDAMGGGRDVADVCEKMIEDGAKIFGAPSVESGGASVAIDGGPVERMANGKFAVNGLRAVPVDEEFLDGCAVRMIADFAFAAVALGIGSVGGGAGFDAGFTSAQSGFCAGDDCGGH